MKTEKSHHRMGSVNSSELRSRVVNPMKKIAATLALFGLFSMPVVASESFTDSISPSGYLAFDAGNQSDTGGLWYQLESSDTRDWLTRYTEPGDTLARSTLSLNQQYSNHTLHFGRAEASDQQFNQFGVTLGRTTVLGFSGDGDTTSTIAHNYNHVDPFHFHGGLRQNYRYDGAHIAYRLNANNQFGFTQTVIRAPDLFDREVIGFDWQGRKASMSLMQVSVGDEDAGVAASGAMQFGSVNVAADYLKAENNASFASLTFQTYLQDGKRLGLRAEQRRNPLFADANENRVTFSLAFDIQSVPRFNAEETEPTEEEAVQKGKGNGLLIGAGVVGAGVALSSGGGGGADSQARFNSQQESAFDVLNRINPTSIRQNREWGGYVYRNADGSYSSTSPIQGELASVTLPAPQSVAPSGGQTTASYHTHAGFDPRFDNENFSPQDILSDIVFGLDGYLATPKGQFKYHNLRANTIVTLGGPGTLATGAP